MNPTRLTEPDYENIEEALMTSSMGRAFLREHAKRARMIAVAEVRDMLKVQSEEQMKLLTQHNGTPVDLIRNDVKAIAVAINRAKAEVQALTEESADGNRFSLATGELSAIVDATEAATSDILAAAEEIGEVADQIESAFGDAAPTKLLSKLQEHVTNIFMACSFQDITGQRVTRVVDVVGFIERRVVGMLAIWEESENGGSEGGGDTSYQIAEPIDERPDAFLCNGPQLNAPDQAEIDALFDAEPGADAEAKAAQAVSDAAKPVATADVAPAPVAPEQAEPATPSTSSSQDDIDAMFDAPAAPVAEAATQAAEAPATEQPAPAASSSQDDIDAMFDAPAAAPASAPAPEIAAEPPAEQAAPSVSASQDDIDAMFDAPAAPAPEPAPAAETPSTPEPAPSAPASQDDIDAMFDAPAAPAAAEAPVQASQDDIDAMFDAPAPAAEVPESPADKAVAEPIPDAVAADQSAGPRPAGPASQEDIDLILAEADADAGATPSPAADMGQDDIDKMFG